MSKLAIITCAFLSISLIGIFSHTAFADNSTVIIPMGASNPHFDTEAQFWYSPPVLTIHVGDTITWLNSDKEIHTVTSGTGIDRGELAQAKTQGKPDGYFDSGPFKPGDSWSFTFEKPGTFYYFCTIHPWMVGALVVSDAIPDVATDAQGNKIGTWPIVKYSQDKQIEADLSWEPHVILTGEKITFIFNFYNPAISSTSLASTSYHFGIVQNGTEIFSSDDVTQYSGGYKYFVFDKPGPVEFKLENIGNTARSTHFSTIVFENPSKIKKDVPVIQPARNLTLSSEVQLVFIGPPVALFVFAIIWLRRGNKLRKKSDKGDQRSAI